jgi:hypothetical protein
MQTHTHTHAVRAVSCSLAVHGTLETIALRLAAVVVSSGLVLVAINTPALMSSWAIRSLFDLNAEATVAVWMSSAILLVIAIVAAACALEESNQSRSPAALGWTLIGGLFIILSIDETAGFHELAGIIVAERVAEVSFLHGVYMWLVVLLPLALSAGAWLLHWFAADGGWRRRDGRYAIAAVVVWLTVPAFEAAASIAGDLPFLVAAEEVSELIGEALMLVAIAIAADRVFSTGPRTRT